MSPEPCSASSRLCLWAPSWPRRLPLQSGRVGAGPRALGRSEDREALREGYRAELALVITTITTGFWPHFAQRIPKGGGAGQAQNRSPCALPLGPGEEGLALHTHPPTHPPQRAPRSPWHCGGSLQTPCGWQTRIWLEALGL